jgi:ABC-2 type transport system permease protein
MTTLAPVSPAPSAAPVAEPAARFRDLVAAEWIKIRSLRSTPWALACITLFVIGSSAVAALADYGNFPHYSPDVRQEHMFSLHDAFPPAGYLTLMLVAGSIGAIAVVSEYGSGLIRTTTVAVPARGSVTLAKAVVVTALWTVVGTVIATGSFAVSQAILNGRHAAISLTYPGAFTALVASAFLAPVCALIGLGLGVLIRHSATTMVISAFTLLMLPVVVPPNKSSSAAVNHTMVLSAWQRLTEVWGPPAAVGFHHYATFAGSWVVYAVWPLVAILLALVVVRRRDV